MGASLDEKLGNSIVSLLVRIFTFNHKVTENGLIAYGGLCTGLGNKINIKDFGQYIVWALKSSDDELARLACGVLSDVASAIGPNIANFLQDFVPPVISILKEAERDRNTKLQAIVALGDIAMHCGTCFAVTYLEEVLNILESAAKMSLAVVRKSDDQALYEYLITLRETLVECYTTIVHGITESASKFILINHSSNLMSFLGGLMQRPIDPSLVKLFL